MTFLYSNARRFDVTDRRDRCNGCKTYQDARLQFREVECARLL